MRNGETVAAFESAFAAYVGAKHGIAMANGTCTLHAALVALGVKPGDKVAVPPLTMASTTIAILHAGAIPVFVDVDPDTWLAENYPIRKADIGMPVSLYGLHWPENWPCDIDDAAQTLRPHSACGFTSYSFQASKILPLGEGGMLVTNDDDLAQRAREFSSLGYKMPDGPKIDPSTLKHPGYARHHSLGWNYRMSDLVAAKGLNFFDCSQGTSGQWDELKWERQICADLYRNAIQGCDWLTPQHVPEGWQHDYWSFAVACDTPERCLWLLDAMERHGGERPFPAWRLTYQEPAFWHLPDGLVSIGRDKPVTGLCPIAEDLQPRLAQFQCNDLQSAERNALALRKCIEEGR